MSTKSSAAAFNRDGPVAFSIDDPHQRDWMNAACPCGSTRPAGECHASRRTKRWKLPQHEPLLTGPPTGQARSGCYAASTNDCFGKLSKEHWISAGILRSPTFGDGKRVNISELFWQQSGAADVLPVSGLSAKVLCERHNNALTTLDSTATRLHSTVEHFYLAQLREHGSRTSEFDLISGEAIERWMLKLIWGQLAAANEIPGLLEDRGTRNTLLKYLFRDGRLPKGWGLYFKGIVAEGVRARSDVGFEARVDIRDGQLLTGEVTLAQLTLTFAFGRMEAGNGAFLRYRPSAIRLFSAFDQACNAIALSWDSRREMPAEYVDLRLRGSRPAGPRR